jgi:hypothetical protein
MSLIIYFGSLHRCAGTGRGLLLAAKWNENENENGTYYLGGLDR